MRGRGTLGTTAALAALMLLGIATSSTPALQVGGGTEVANCTNVFGGLPAEIKPRLARVRPGETTRFTVAVSNERAGCTVASGFIAACARVRDGAIREIRLPDCRTIRPVAPGSTRRKRLPVKARTRAEGRYRIQVRILEQAERAPVPQGTKTVFLRVVPDGQAR